VVDTYAFCLLHNHFHLLIGCKQDLSGSRLPRQTFSNLFNAYAKSINIAYQRTGLVFERPFKSNGFW